MRVGVGNDLPVKPRKTSGSDLTGPRLDIIIPRAGRQNAAGRTVVVRGGKVTCSPSE